MSFGESRKPMEGKVKLTDVEGRIMRSTAAAVHFSTTGEDKDATWLPNALIEVQPVENGNCVVTMPEWLAIDRKLV